jgi:hypothetical protein
MVQLASPVEGKILIKLTVPQDQNDGTPIHMRLFGKLPISQPGPINKKNGWRIAAIMFFKNRRCRLNNH